MKQKLKCLLVLLLFSQVATAQKQGQASIDSMLQALPHAKEDTTKANLLTSLSFVYSNVDPKEGIKYGEDALSLATKLNWKEGIAKANNCLGISHLYKSDFADALNYFQTSLKMYQDIRNNKGVANETGNIGNVYINEGDLPNALEYLVKALKMNEELGNRYGVAVVTGNIGNIYYGMNDYPKALEFLSKALNFYQETGNKNGIANMMGNLGRVYKKQSDYPRALDCYFKALKVNEELGNKQNVAAMEGNIGTLFAQQNDFPKALQYNLESMKIYEELGDVKSIERTTENIAGMYILQGDYDKALEFYFKVLKINEEAGNNGEIAFVSGNISEAYARKKNYPMSIAYAQKALKLDDETKDPYTVGQHLVNLSHAFLMLVDDTSHTGTLVVKNEIPEGNNPPVPVIPVSKSARLQQAMECLQKALTLAKAINAADLLQVCYENLTVAYKLAGDYKKSQVCEENYWAIKDSVFSNENNEKIVKLGMKNEYDRQRLSDSLKVAEKERLTHIQLQRQRTFTWTGIGVVLLLSGFTFVINRNNRLLKTEKQKSELLLKEIKVKNKEITDNISYAQRIQSAILPDIQLIYKALKQSFVLFMPKDIVSGDFYAFAERNNRIIIIAGDCTGHGVSGAFMSMIGSSLLNQIINEKGIDKPGEILNQLNIAVMEALKQSATESAVADGMDISVCAFDLEKNVLQFAGANRPLWMVRNNYIEAFKPDKYPIGGLQAVQELVFTNCEIPLQKNDTFYVFTDGYADQFGGEKVKKMMTAKFKEVLLSIQSMDMREQEIYLKGFFEKWKGANEQVDDVLVIGVRV